MSSTNLSSLLAELQRRYQVGPRYAEAYLTYWIGNGKCPTCLQEILSAPQPGPMWFDYAMSANQRGQAFFENIRDLLPPVAGRYLDVGCGFGGFLVAFAQRGFDVCGVEIDPLRVALSRANCQDCGVGEVIEGSILDGTLMGRLGRFDVITCNDVIEHVLDVPKTMEHMVRLLNPDGVLVLEIPNRDFVGFVAADGHFNLFGITQLDRNRAIEYHRNFFSFAYDVGDYHPLEYYEQLLATLGCQGRLRASEDISTLALLRAFMSQLKQLYARHGHFKVEVASKLSPQIVREIQKALTSYRRELYRRLASTLLSAGARRTFQRHYLIPFWTIIATKS